jgi:hypothetical protein
MGALSIGHFAVAQFSGCVTMSWGVLTLFRSNFSEAIEGFDP